MILRVFAILVMVAMLAGCASPRPSSSPAEISGLEAYQERFEQISTWANWGLTARLGIDDGRDGGSGRLDWTVAGQESQLQFRGALGQGAWQLQVANAGAVLQRSDGSVARAATVSQLVTRELGWQVPVDALSWWVRGLAAPGMDRETDLVTNSDGTPVSLVQEGWSVVFNRYEDVAGERVPDRLEATRDRYRIKLAISRWRGGGAKEDG